MGSPENLTDEGRAKGRAVLSERAKNNINTKQAKAYAKVLKEQGYNYAQIANLLNEHQYKTARGGKYYRTSAERLITNQ